MTRSSVTCSPTDSMSSSPQTKAEPTHEDVCYFVAPSCTAAAASAQKSAARTRDKDHCVKRPSAEEEMSTSPWLARASQRRCHNGPQCLVDGCAVAMGVACTAAADEHPNTACAAFAWRSETRAEVAGGASGD